LPIGNGLGQFFGFQVISRVMTKREEIVSSPPKKERKI